MGKLVFGGFLAVLGIVLILVAAAWKENKSAGMLRTLGIIGLAIGALFAVTAIMVVIDPGEVGVRHAFGTVDPAPLLPGIRLVAPWSEIERYSTREEQFPESGDQRETMEALSSEQMAMQVDVGLRWQIDPSQARRIFTEIGAEPQIHSAVLNA